eukprot:6538527-Prymnesium_polylepis.1
MQQRRHGRLVEQLRLEGEQLLHVRLLALGGERVHRLLQPVAPHPRVHLGSGVAGHRLAQVHAGALGGVGLARLHEGCHVRVAQELDARAIGAAHEQPRGVRPVGVLVVDDGGRLGARELVAEHQVDVVALAQRHLEDGALRVLGVQRARHQVEAVHARRLVRRSSGDPGELRRVVLHLALAAQLELSLIHISEPTRRS